MAIKMAKHKNVGMGMGKAKHKAIGKATKLESLKGKGPMPKAKAAHKNTGKAKHKGAKR